MAQFWGSDTWGGGTWGGAGQTDRDRSIGQAAGRVVNKPQQGAVRVVNKPQQGVPRA